MFVCDHLSVPIVPDQGQKKVPEPLELKLLMGVRIKSESSTSASGARNWWVFPALSAFWKPMLQFSLTKLPAGRMGTL